MVSDFIQINPMFTSVIDTDLWRHYLVIVYYRELFEHLTALLSPTTANDPLLYFKS